MAIKILYVITTGNMGGAQRHLHDLIAYRPNGYEIHVAMGQQGWLWEELSSYSNVKLHQIESLVREISPIKDVCAFFSLINLIKNIKPAIIHCHSSKAGLLGRIAGCFLKIPSVFTAHGWAFTDGVSKVAQFVYKYIESWAANLAEYIICVSHYDHSLALACMRKNSHKLITIHNCIPDLPFKEMLDLHSSERLRLIMIARFLPQKDQVLLIKALYRLKLKGIQFFTSFVGQGDLLKTTQVAARQLMLEDEDVVFLGERKDISSLLDAHHIFVLTSNWEGFPISILEGMRQGKPIIASDVGGVKEAVTDGENGFLIPRGDIDYLCTKLEQIFYDRKMLTNMSFAARSQFQNHFKIENMINSTYDVYQKIWRNLKESKYGK